jgi:predicted membrane protein
MPIISIILTIVVVGFVLWLVNRYLPMDGKIKTILNWVVVILLIIWLLRALGLLSGVGIR